MKVETKPLDTQFGLFSWHGFPVPRRLCGEYLCGHCEGSCNGEVLVDPTVDGECSCIGFCDTCEVNCIACKELDEKQFETDAMVAWQDEFRKHFLGYGGSAPPKDARKVNMIAKALIVSLYQSIVERWGISRTLSCDNFAGQLALGLKCLDCRDCLTLPDGMFPHFRDSVARHLAGAIGGKVSDGEFFKATIEEIVRFVAESAMYCNLYPITMSGILKCDCLIPDPSNNVMITDEWMNECFFKVPDCSCDMITPLNKIAKQFGLVDWLQLRNRWTNDMSLRRNIRRIDIGCQQCDPYHPQAGFFLRDLLLQLTSAMSVDSCQDIGRMMCVVANASVNECSCFNVCADISGKYAYILGYFLRQVYCGCDPFPTTVYCSPCRSMRRQLVRKHYGAAFGYGWTVAGGFGQNVAVFEERRLEIRKRTLRAGRVVGARAYVRRTDPTRPCSCTCYYCDCYGEFHCVIKGNCKHDESVGFAFSPFEEEEPFVYGSSVYTNEVTADARVLGYGAALPWVGGDKLLYLMDFNCSQKSTDAYHFSCGEVDYETLIKSGKDDVKDFYTYQEMEQMYGRLWFCLNACWMDTCSKDGLCVRNVCFNDNYPAQQVLKTCYKNFVKDVSLLFALRNHILKDLCGGGWFQTCEYSGVEFRKAVDVVFDCNRGTWIREPLIKFLIELYNYVRGRIAYVSSGFYHYCAHRGWGEELPDSVRVVKRFPITCEQIWGSGDNSLLDPRPAEAWSCELNDPDTIQTSGYLATKIIFGNPMPYTSAWWNGFGIQPIEAVFTDPYGYEWRGELEWVDREFPTGEGPYAPMKRVRGWRVGNIIWIGNFHSVYGRWEPYNQLCVDRIGIGDPFGIVRWDYKASRRVPHQ